MCFFIFGNWQKEEDGEILNSLGRPETTFEQSGLGPGQEYEVKLQVVKNNKLGKPASKSVVTSEFTHSCSQLAYHSFVLHSLKNPLSNWLNILYTFLTQMH